ncbi:MAG: hypothetical protein ACQ9ET_03960 [Nitrosomonadaceae bacterium]
MADTVGVKYIYPPDWDGFYDNERNGHRRIVAELHGISDGTGESAVKKLVLGDFRRSDGQFASGFSIEKIQYSIQGNHEADATAPAYIELFFDSTPDEHIAILQGSDTIEYVGGRNMQAETGTGDILLTSTNMTASDTYSIIITARLK